MSVEEILVVCMFLSFITALFAGVHVAFALGGIGVIFAGFGFLSDMYLGTITGLDYLTLGLIVNRIYKIMDNWVLVALPMFIFMGLMLDQSGVAERLMHSMQELFGKVRGGLAITVTVIGIILAASTGIIGASVVLLGVISLPAMLKQGYNKSFAVGTVASAGTLGILIPPSIMLVIMADQLALSVGDLFAGAIIPGFFLGVIYVVYIIFFGLFKPEQAPLDPNRRPYEMKLVLDVLKAIVPTLILIISVLGSIFAGIATPTEASGVGALGATILAIQNKKFDFNVLNGVLRNTFGTTAYIFAIFLGATCFALVLRELGGDEMITNLLQGLPFDGIGVVLFILCIVFVLGFVLDWIEITLIILPLLAPIVGSLELGIPGYGLDEPELVWFVMLVAIALQTSFLTPPVGFALFYVKGVCPPEVSMSDIYRGVLPFVLLQLITLGLVLTFPSMVTWLPSIAYQ